MTQPNRPTPRFTPADWVWTPADWRGWILSADYTDGAWTYQVVKPNSERPLRYAEHELTEV